MKILYQEPECEVMLLMAETFLMGSNSTGEDLDDPEDYYYM